MPSDVSGPAEPDRRPVAATGFLALLRRVVTGRRAGRAVVANGLLSLLSLVLAVVVARSTGVAEFGDFALAAVVFTLGNGAIRAATTESTLASGPDQEMRERCFRRAGLLAVVIAALIAGWGTITQNPYLLILAVGFHGLAIADFIRTTEAALFDARFGLMTAVVWAVPAGGLCLVDFVVPIPPLVVFAGWVGSGALTGYGALALRRYPWLPSWPRERGETRTAALFMADYAVGSGGASFTTALLGMGFSTTFVGAVRGAGTALGPVNLIASSARSLIIPFLARGRSQPVSVARQAARVTAVLVVLTAPLLALVVALPRDWGTALLGATWDNASLVLVPLAVESLLGLVASVPAAGHRAALAGGRTLALRVATGVPRPFVVLGAAALGGVVAAAWSMVAIAAVNAVTWWVSYVRISAAAGGPEPRQP